MVVAVPFAHGLFPAVVVGVFTTFKPDRNVDTEIDHPGSRAAVLDQLLDPLVEMSAVDEDHVGIREGLDIRGSGFVIVRIGVRLEELGYLDLLAPDLAHHIRDLGRGRDCAHGRSAATGTVTGAAPGEEGTTGNHRSSETEGPSATSTTDRRPADRDQAEHDSAQNRDRCTGGNVRHDREPDTEDSLDRGQGEGAGPESRKSLRHQSDGGCRNDQQGDHQQRPDRVQCRDYDHGHRHQQRRIEPARAGADLRGRLLVEAPGQPVSGEEARGDDRQKGRAGGKGQVIHTDREQGAEQEGVDVCARLEDVAGQDYSGRKEPDQGEGRDRVGGRVPDPSEQRGEGSEGSRRAEGQQLWGEPDPVGQDQPGKGRDPDRVGEE